ncbi:MAG: Ig-like domain-containing protein [Anaerolineales bacterium]|nr:Ig-like domain-containing protein [Anaerolineales bacterium]
MKVSSDMFSAFTTVLRRRLARRNRGQGLVEFALILPLLLLLVLGIIEAGRLLVIYSSVQAASREAARYASAAGEVYPGVPYYLDSAGIAAAANRIAVLVAPSSVTITYDHGPDTSTFTPASASDVQLRDRVNIAVAARYEPILGLTPLQGFDITAVTSRTIIKEVSIEPGGGGGGGGSNNPPMVNITSPNSGEEFLPSETICFSATATDTEDGDLSASIQWSSNPSGLSGSGGNTCTTLSEGEYTITAQVFDSDGNVGTDSITILVNGPPQVTILSPNSGIQVEEGTLLTFQATAFDTLDGDLSSQIVWLDNGVQFRTGASFTYSTLALGFHTITAQATDQHGLTGSASVTLAVIARTPPNVIILSPPNGVDYAVGTAVVFSGEAIDAKDGDLSASLQWSSSLDGFLGSGAGFTTSALRPGTHTITASATDSDGLTGSATVTIRIVDDSPPVVNILSPIDGAHFNRGQIITFSGTASDTVDGNLTSSLTWYSSISGQIGSGGSFTRSNLPAGPHTITARVTDSDNLTGVDQVVIYIDDVNTPPTVVINSPGDNTTFRQRDPIHFSGTATDPQEGDLSALIQWVSSIDGSIGSGSSFTLTTLSPGTHVITATVTDYGGLSAHDTVSIVVNELICPAPGSAVFSYTGQNVDKLTWILTIPSGVTQTDPFVMTALSIDLFNPQGAVLSSVTVEGQPVPFSRSGDLYTATANPVWSGFFRSNGTIEVIFNFDPRARRDRSGPFTMRAAFSPCDSIQSVASP